MDDPSQFPNDANGHVLHRMYLDGDDLTKPRMVEFCFIFLDRQKTLAFASAVDEPDYEVSISYYKERNMWQALVKRHMIPEHARISEIEATLTQEAQKFSGQADGWGCMQIRGS